MFKKWLISLLLIFSCIQPIMANTDNNNNVETSETNSEDQQENSVNNNDDNNMNSSESSNQNTNSDSKIISIDGNRHNEQISLSLELNEINDNNQLIFPEGFQFINIDSSDNNLTAKVEKNILTLTKETNQNNINEEESDTPIDLNITGTLDSDNNIPLNFNILYNNQTYPVTLVNQGLINNNGMCLSSVSNSEKNDEWNILINDQGVLLNNAIVKLNFNKTINLPKLKIYQIEDNNDMTLQNNFNISNNQIILGKINKPYLIKFELPNQNLLLNTSLYDNNKYLDSDFSNSTLIDNSPQINKNNDYQLVIFSKTNHGQPLANMHYLLENDKGTVIDNNLVSDQNGLIELNNLKPGHYSLISLSKKHHKIDFNLTNNKALIISFRHHKHHDYLYQYVNKDTKHHHLYKLDKRIFDRGLLKMYDKYHTHDFNNLAIKHLFGNYHRLLNLENPGMLEHMSKLAMYFKPKLIKDDSKVIKHNIIKPIHTDIDDTNDLIKSLIGLGFVTIALLITTLVIHKLNKRK